MCISHEHIWFFVFVFFGRNEGADSRVSQRQRCFHYPDRFKGREHHRHGAADHGLRLQNLLRQEHHRRGPLLPLQQAVQDAETGLHRLQAPGLHDVQSRADSPDHHGFAPKGNPGVLQRPGGQPESVTIFAAVHPGRDSRLQERCDCGQISCICKESFAERLRLGIAVIHGEAQDAESDLVDGRHSPPTAKSIAAIHPSLEIPMLIPKEKPPITVVGDVGGRIAIIVDDIIDDVDSFLAAAETLKERGAYKIFVMATHGLLSSDAPRLIEESAIDEVVVTNTVPHEIQKLQCPKIKTVDISLILSEAIRRIHNGESMSYLFRNIGLDD
ncbi:phosphoribosyl pyrophosphate synthase-associated protein 2 isoform 3-T6 [Vipera latastei]